MKFGDAIETYAKPFAKAMHLDCLETTGNLKPESECAKRRNAINNLGDSVWNFLWTDQSEPKKE